MQIFYEYDDEKWHLYRLINQDYIQFLFFEFC